MATTRLNPSLPSAPGGRDRQPTRPGWHTPSKWTPQDEEDFRRRERHHPNMPVRKHDAPAVN